jgi:hypothetical protein
MTSLHTSRRGRRKSTFGRASEVLAFALDLAGKGERVRLCLSWMDSFHDPSFSVVCLHGPAVRHPMTVNEMVDTIYRSEKRIGLLFSLSRKAD